ncbi:MAG: 5-oxoprolinase subunit PxpB [Reichenbachiella sp.]
MRFELAYRRFGEQAILIEWPEEIAPEISTDINQLCQLIEVQLKELILEYVIAYNSLTLFLNEGVDYEKTVGSIKRLYTNEQKENVLVQKSWKIPVCYEDEFELDLARMSDELDLSKDRIIDIHSGSLYRLYFIGFLPGFMYLGGLDSRIYFPRISEPRTNVPKGAVGIAGRQTGIYPIDSPAGWNIIGNSPIEFFDVTSPNPCFAKSGDQISFHPITYEEHVDLAHDVKFGKFDPQSLII